MVSIIILIITDLKFGTKIFPFVLYSFLDFFLYKNVFFMLLHNKLPSFSRTDIFRWICKYLRESKLMSIIKGIKESYVIYSLHYLN